MSPANDVNELLRFCACYISHPNIDASNSIPGEARLPHIRFSLLPNEILRKARMCAQEFQFIADHSFESNVKRVWKLASTGYDLYYFCNQVREDLGSGKVYAKNSNIARRLFLPVDIDRRLPCDWCAVEEELGLQFAYVVRTSTADDGSGRYHFAVPVDIGPAENNAPIEEISAALCALFKSDKISDAKRILRAPGSINWKRSAGKKRGEEIWSRLELAREGFELYTLDEVRAAIERAKDSQLFKEIRINIAEESTVSRRQRMEHGEEGESTGLPDNFPGWEKALEKAPKAPLYPATCGFRHNALRTWSAQMCHDGLLWPQVLANMRTLAEKAFSEDYSGNRDFKALLRTTWQYFQKTSAEEKALDFSEFDASGEEDSYSEFRDFAHKNSASGATQQAAAINTDIKQRDFAHKNSASDSGGSNSNKIRKAFKSLNLSLIEFAKELSYQLPTESENDYLKFLAKCLSLFKQAKDPKGGTYEPLCNILYQRLVKIRMARSSLIAVPTFEDQGQHQANGLCVLLPRILNESHTKDFLVEYVSAICSAVTRTRMALSELPEVKSKGTAYIIKMNCKGTTLVSTVAGILGKIRLHEKTIEQTSEIIVLQNGVFSLADENAGSFIDDEASAWYEQARWKYPNPITRFYRPQHLLNGSEIGDKRSLMPMFYSYLDDTFSGDDNRVTREELIWRIIGYCLIRGNPLQKFFGFIGARRAGKGVLCDILSEIVGPRGGVQISYNSLAEPWGFGPLEEKILCIADEAENSDRRTHENCMSGIKRYTGGRRFSLRKMREDERIVDTTAKIIITCNKDLTISDTHGAVMARLVCLYFANPRGNSEQISDLGKKIVQGEGDIIASWASIKLASAWPLGASIFDVMGSSALDRGREELEGMVNPVAVVLRSMVRRSEGVSLGSGVLTEIIGTLIKTERIPKPNGQLGPNIKIAMRAMGFEYSRKTEFRGFLNCSLVADGIMSVFDDTPEAIAQLFQHSNHRKEIHALLGLVDDCEFQ